MDEFAFPVQVSDALPPDTLMLVSPRRVTQVQLPDGRIIERAEPAEEWARRCAVLRMGRSAA